MTFDAITLAAVRDEIERYLLGGRVERVVLPADLTLGVEFYAHGTKRWLLASAHPQQARVHLAGERLARASEEVSPLLLLLRKYVRDARLIAVEQPAWERVLVLAFAKRDEDGALLESRVIIEIMGRHSNIVLVSPEGKVLDSMKRVSAAMSRQRTILPGQPYLPPPPQSKAAPAELSAAELRALVEGTASPQTGLSQSLVAALAGISPLLAREVAFRANGAAGVKVGDADWEGTAAALRAIVDEARDRRWQPSVGLIEDTPAAFAAYELHQFPARRAIGSVSEAAEAFYASAVRPARAGETGKAALAEVLAGVRSRAERRRAALRDALPRFDEAERLRRWGELLLAFGHGAERGAKELQVEREVIALDPRLGAVENAQAYFKEYHKAKAGLEEVPRLLEATEVELAFIAQVETDLALAASVAETEEVRQELKAVGLLREPEGKKRKGRDKALPLGRPIASADGLDILVGRSARQNERVTFELATGNDLWLHARGIPGAHVVVKARGREVPEATLREAAAYAAYFSQARESASVTVDYTLQRHVRRLKGGPPGMVNYSQEKTLHVAPAPPRRPGAS